MVDFRPCLLVYRCPIVVFLRFSRCLLISFSVRSGHVFGNAWFIALMRLAVVGMKISACRYYDSSGLFVCTRILFFTSSDCCVSRVTSHIEVFLFLVPLIISCQFFWTDIFCVLVWWFIHCHIRILMILVGLLSFLGKCVSTLLACL